MATRVLDHRSVSYHWRLNAHRGAVNCLWVRVVPETNLQRVYTGGEDGALRVWDHKGNVAMEMTGHTAPIHAIFFANGKIYTGDDEGWICVWNERESRRILKWRAHEPTEESSRCRITKIQVVSEGRVFTGSWDGTVRLWDPHEESDDIPLQREFPPPAQAHNDPVETFQVVKGNLLFTAHRGGCIRIWNMQEDLLKVIRARGVTARFRCMQVSTTHLSDNCTKVNIYVGVENRIFLFEIKRRRIVMDGDPDSDNWEFDIDRVRSLEKLSGVTTDVLSIWVVYEDAMQTDEPAMYVGGADGNTYLTIPTDKAVYVDLGSRAMRFKNYTFKGQGGGTTCIAVSGGKVFAGNSGGGLTCFKEPYNMEKLRYYSRTVKPYNTTKNLAPIGPRPVRATTTITTTTTRSTSSSAGGSPASFSRATTSSSSSSGSSYPDSLSSSGKDLQFPDISSLRIKEEPSYPVQQVQPQFMSYSSGGSVPGAIPSANPALASFAAATNPANLQSFNSGLQFQQLPNGQFVLADPNAFALQQQQQQQQQQAALNSLSMPQAGAGGFSFPSMPDPSGASQPGAFNPALFSLSNPALGSQFSMPMGGSFGSGLDQGQGQAPGQGQMDPLQQQLLQQQLLQQQLQLQQQQLQQQMQLQQQQLQQPQFLTLPDGTQVPIASFQQNPMGLQSLPAGVPVSAASLGLSSLPQTGSMPGSSAAPPAASGGGAEKKEPCCICYDAPRNALIYPCGHACICYNCSRELLKQTKRICPLCRKNIRDIVKIFD